MSNFNIMGSYSGIDMSVIDQMIEAEKSKGVQFTNRKDKIEREQGAWKDVGTRLTALTQKTDVLSRRDTFESRTVKSSATGNAAVSVTAGNSAPVGDYRVHVEQMATSSRLTGGRIDLNLGMTDTEMKKNAIDRVLGQTDSFKFKNADGKTFEIEVTEEDSLRKITENINAEVKESGIRASIVDNRLILTDTKMGDRAISIDANRTTTMLGLASTQMTGDQVNLAGITSGSTFLFENADGLIEVTIEATGDTVTLSDIVTAINSKTGESGVAASFDLDGRLLLTGNQDIKFDEENNDVLKALGFIDTTIAADGTEIDSVKSQTRIVSVAEKGQGAVFTIDGLEIQRNTNRISDAIEGMAFTLTSKHTEGESELISITNNTQKGVDAVKEFVDQYNSVMNFIQTQTDVGTPSEDNNTTGALVGEGSILRLQSSLRSMLGGEIKGSNKIRIASQIGIEVDRYGVATLDEAKLNEALREDPESVARFFYQPEAASDAGDPAPAGKSVAKEKGMSELFKNLVDSYTSKTKGIISTKNKSYERMVKEINEQIETFNERIDKKRARYIQQFAALDEAMMRAESQMEYLYSQMNIE